VHRVTHEDRRHSDSESADASPKKMQKRKPQLKHTKYLAEMTAVNPDPDMNTHPGLASPINIATANGVPRAEQVAAIDASHKTSASAIDITNKKTSLEALRSKHSRNRESIAEVSIGEDQLSSQMISSVNFQSRPDRAPLLDPALWARQTAPRRAMEAASFGARITELEHRMVAVEDAMHHLANARHRATTIVESSRHARKISKTSTISLASLDSFDLMPPSLQDEDLPTNGWGNRPSFSASSLEDFNPPTPPLLPRRKPSSKHPESFLATPTSVYSAPVDPPASPPPRKPTRKSSASSCNESVDFSAPATSPQDSQELSRKALEADVQWLRQDLSSLRTDLMPPTETPPARSHDPLSRAIFPTTTRPPDSVVRSRFRIYDSDDNDDQGNTKKKNNNNVNKCNPRENDESTTKKKTTTRRPAAKTASAAAAVKPMSHAPPPSLEQVSAERAAALGHFKHERSVRASRGEESGGRGDNVWNALCHRWR